jgi:hypothetical protein
LEPLPGPADIQEGRGPTAASVAEDSVAEPTAERYRELVAAHVAALTQLSDLQLDYSRLLNAASRSLREIQALQARTITLEQALQAREQALQARTRALEEEREQLWRSGVAQAAEARRYASSLEARIDRVNRGLIRRILHRLTGRTA